MPYLLTVQPHLLANNTPFSLLYNLTFMIHALSAHCTVSPSHYQAPCATLQCTAYKLIPFSVQHLLLALQLGIPACCMASLAPSTLCTASPACLAASTTRCVQPHLLSLQLLLFPVHIVQPHLLALNLLLLAAHCTASPACLTASTAHCTIHLIHLISLPKEILF